MSAQIWLWSCSIWYKEVHCVCIWYFMTSVYCRTALFSLQWQAIEIALLSFNDFHRIEVRWVNSSENPAVTTSTKSSNFAFLCCCWSLISSRSQDKTNNPLDDLMLYCLQYKNGVKVDRLGIVACKSNSRTNEVQVAVCRAAVEK